LQMELDTPLTSAQTYTDKPIWKTTHSESLKPYYELQNDSKYWNLSVCLVWEKKKKAHMIRICLHDLIIQNKPVYN
jgi:hypothetical protein